MSEHCIFCKIVAGAIPSKKAYEDEDFLAFHDIHPAAPLHLLIIPKKHIPSLGQCETGEDAMLGRLFALAPKLARENGYGFAGTDKSGVGGFKTIVNTGPGGGQEVYHIHIHVLGGTLSRLA